MRNETLTYEKKAYDVYKTKKITETVKLQKQYVYKEKIVGAVKL